MNPLKLILSLKLKNTRLSRFIEKYVTALIVFAIVLVLGIAVFLCWLNNILVLIIVAIILIILI